MEQFKYPRAVIYTYSTSWHGNGVAYLVAVRYGSNLMLLTLRRVERRSPCAIPSSPSMGLTVSLRVPDTAAVPCAPFSDARVDSPDIQVVVLVCAFAAAAAAAAAAALVAYGLKGGDGEKDGGSTPFPLEPGEPSPLVLFVAASYAITRSSWAFLASVLGLSSCSATAAKESIRAVGLGKSAKLSVVIALVVGLCVVRRFLGTMLPNGAASAAAGMPREGN